jgi:hypothetical protein
MMKSGVAIHDPITSAGVYDRVLDPSQDDVVLTLIDPGKPSVVPLRTPPAPFGMGMSVSIS